MLIEMAVSMVKEHISSTEVLTGVRYMWVAVLMFYAHPLFSIIVYLYKLANTVTVICDAQQCNHTLWCAVMSTA